MPQKTFSSQGAAAAGQIAAGGIYEPLTGWQYEFCPFAANIKVICAATPADGSMLLTIFSGAETIQEESPVPGGLTAGVIPAELNYPPIVWQAPAGDRLKLRFRNTNAAAKDVAGVIYIYPLR
jgi:hypothetical protein